MHQAYVNYTQLRVNKMAKENKAGQPASFKPEALTVEQQEAVIEFYLGVHPKYFVYEGTSAIKIDIYRMAMDGITTNGFKKGVTA